MTAEPPRPDSLPAQDAPAPGSWPPAPAEAGAAAGPDEAPWPGTPGAGPYKAPWPGTPGADAAPAPLPSDPGGTPGWPTPPAVPPPGADGPGFAAMPVPPVAPQKKGRTGLLAVGAAVVVGGGGLLLKYGLGFLAATVVSGALGGVFGGPFEKLPSDQKQAFEQRYKAAVGTSLDGLSDDAAVEKLNTLITDGLPRLGDPVLIDRLQVFTLILQTTDEATCAALSRTMAVGEPDDKAFAKAVEALEIATYARWVEVNISAIEAQTAGTPAPRTPSEDAVNTMFDHLTPRLTEAEVNGIVALSDGKEVADAEACASFRALYKNLIALDPVDVTTAALYEVTP